MDNWPTVTSRENGWKSQISQTTHFVKWQVNFRSKKWTIWGSKWNVFIKLISNETFKKSSSNGQINKSSSQMTVFHQKLDFHHKIGPNFSLLPHAAWESCHVLLSHMTKLMPNGLKQCLRVCPIFPLSPRKVIPIELKLEFGLDIRCVH